jgi:AcrR family transcriptional regulator
MDKRSFINMTNRFEEKREKTKAAITEAALALFAERGFDRTSVRQIAERAGISLGLLYNYFSGKDELLGHIFRKGQQDIRDSFAQPAEATPLQIIENHIRQAFRIIKQKRSFWKMLHGIRLQSPVIQRLEAEMRAETEFIQEQVRQNLAAAGVPSPELEARFLFASLDGIAHHYLLHQDYPVDEVAQILIQKYLNHEQHP